MFRIVFVALILSSCAQQSPNDIRNKAVQEIIDADLAMSDLATKDGFFNALLAYAEDSVIMPRPGELPIMSKDEAQTNWKTKPVIKELTWKPIKVTASESGDIGFSFGIATYQGKDTTTYTNYCTIWHKQKDGTWKFMFDGGNSTVKQ